MRRNSRKLALAARICFLLGLSDGLPSSLRMLPSKRHNSISRHHESQNVTFTSKDNYFYVFISLTKFVPKLKTKSKHVVFVYKLEGLVAYSGHLSPFLILGGRPTPQLFVSYEKSSLQLHRSNQD